MAHISAFIWWDSLRGGGGLTVSDLHWAAFSASGATALVTVPLLKLGLLSCLSTLISRLMYAFADGELLRDLGCSSNTGSALEFLRLFPDRRLSQTFPSFGELPAFLFSSVAEFFRFLPDRRDPTPPPPPPVLSAEEFLRWPVLEAVALVPMLATRPALLALGCVPDSEAERILSVPFFRFMGNSLNHFAILTQMETSKPLCLLRHFVSPYTRAPETHL